MKLLTALAIGLSFAAFSASQAAPLAPIDQSVAPNASIIQVAQGCGPGFHRGPMGACRPLYNCPPG